VPVIDSRVARVTYGIKAARPFAEGDPVASRIVLGGVPHVWIFETFIKRGEEIPADHEVKKQYTAASATQVCAELPILTYVNPASPMSIDVKDTTVKYFHEDGVKVVANLRLDFKRSAVPGGVRTSLDVTFKFGCSVVEVFAKCLGNGVDESEPTKIDIPYQFES
jgi:hypothetical protein